MTKKLFYDNSFMQEFDAVVISCENDKKGWAVVLDQTAFYPEGGGQPRDQGVIAFGQTTVNVLDTREKNGVIIHYTDGEIPVGTQVHGEIDWVRKTALGTDLTNGEIFAVDVQNIFCVINP